MQITIKEASLAWGISERRIRTLCKQGKIPGAFLAGRIWMLPDGASKPMDARFTSFERALAEINRLKSELDSKRPLTQDELSRLNEDFTVRYTYNSNAIEGNTLTLRETDLVLRGLTIGEKPLKDHLEAVGHKEAFDYITELVKEKQPLSEFMIRQIHFLVLSDKPQGRGKYREVPVRIAGAKHIPVEPFLIEQRLSELLDWYKNDSSMDFISRLARFHIEFEAIHPFIDGNGRTGRLLVNLELMKMGYPPIDIKYTDRVAYYDAFDAYHVSGDLKPMSLIFADYLKERLREYLSVIKK